MVNESTMKRISNDLFSIATRLGEDAKLADSDGAGKRLVNKLVRLRESVMEIIGTLQTGEVMNAGILRSIFEKAHRAEHVGPLTTIKMMRLIAKELYQIDQVSFDSFISSFVIDNPDMVEFGRGISSGLGLDDALLIKTPTGDEYIYYLMLKPSKECDF